MRAPLPLFLVLALAACSERAEVGFNPMTSAGSSGDAGGSGGTPAAAAGRGGAVALGGTAGVGGSAGVAGEPPCEPAACRGKIYQCGDCQDNDQDGVIDSRDPECLGPCDDAENSFFSGDARETGCQLDCYFDRNSGVGDDCAWHHACDPLSVAPNYPPSGEANCRYEPSTTLPRGQTCAQASSGMGEACRNNCAPLTPNGCDCFGCCELPARSGRYVWLGSTEGRVGTCDAASAEDPSACRPCTPVPSCFNECEECDVCVGSTRHDPTCGGDEPMCEGALGACDADSSCPSGSYCITGCCVALPR